jgi:hypothetical protein
MKTRKRNASVAIIANKNTMKMRNAEAANGSPQVPHPAVVASSRRATRSNPGRHAASLVGGGNEQVADKTPAATVLDAAPAEGGTTPPAHQQQLDAKDAEIRALQQQLEDHPANQKTKPPSPRAQPAPSPLATAPPAGGTAEEPATAQRAEKEAEVAALFAAHKAKPANSTEAADVAAEAAQKYWVDNSDPKSIVIKHGSKIALVLKPKPKPKPQADSRTGLGWVGFCVEGCGCDVCVAKRAEPSKTEMHNSKRVSKKPSS